MRALWAEPHPSSPTSWARVIIARTLRVKQEIQCTNSVLRRKRTALPTAGVRAGCVRARTLTSLHRMITSAELPRNVTRSTSRVPWFDELSASAAVFVEKLDRLRTKEQLRCHSRLPFDAALRDEGPIGVAISISSHGLAAIAFDLCGDKIRTAQEIRRHSMRRAQIEDPPANRSRSARPHA